MTNMKRFCSILLSILFLLISAVPALAERVVRVGYYYAPNFQEGRSDEEVKRGYSYEYLQRVADIAKWKYEYVYAPEAELYRMLRSGDIDILAGIAYTARRGNDFLYPDRPMGTETYTLYVRREDSDTFRVRSGISIGSILGGNRTEQLELWLITHGVSANVRTFEDEEQMNRALFDGTVDAVLESDNTVINSPDMVPYRTIGRGEYYVIAAAGKYALLGELNAAQEQIERDTPDFLYNLQNRYYAHSAVNAILSADERDYVARHSKIVYGFVDGMMPLCETDENGNATGALCDAIREMHTTLKIEDVCTAEFRAYPDPRSMYEALKNGEIEAGIPFANSLWHAEKSGFEETDPILNVSMSLVYVGEDPERDIVVASEDPLQKIYVETNFESEPRVIDGGIEACLEEVLAGRASGTVLNSYQTVRIREENKYQSLHVAELVQNCRLCVITREGDHTLTRLVNRGIGMVEDSNLQNHLLQYMEDAYTYTWEDFIREYDHLLVLICLVILAVVFGIFGLHIISLRSKNAELTVANDARAIAEEEARRMLRTVETDDLTGVYTRQAFNERAGMLLKSRPDEKYDLWIMDVINFKLINSIHGVNMGNALLVYLAGYMKRFVSEGMMGRMGADQLVALVPANEQLGEQLENASQRIEINAPMPNVVVKFGVYENVDHELPMPLICDRAMSALKSIKRNYEHRVIRYDGEISREFILDNELETAFAEALNSGEFHVWYQPKYNTRSEHMNGAEALVRWIRGDGTMISPGRFIPLFESDGLIRRLDEYVFTRVCADLREWTEAGLEPVPVSVNLSRGSLHTGDLADRYRDIAMEAGIPVKLVPLELTESAILSAQTAGHMTEELRMRGFSLHMDDFGTGYSSLSAMNALPFDVLKLDKTLTDTIGQAGSNETLRHIVELAHYKGMSVVAEGVERAEQLEFLKHLSCDAIQGYYFSRPISREEFTELLRNRPKEPFMEDDSNRKVKMRHRTGAAKYLTALGQTYLAMFVLDIENDRLLEYSAEQKIADYLIGSVKANEQARNVVLNRIAPEYIAQALDFVDLKTVCERLKGKRSISEEFIGVSAGWIRMEIISAADDIMETPKDVLLTVRIIDEEKRHEIDLIEASRTDVLTGLSNRRSFEDMVESYKTLGMPGSLAVVGMDVNDLKATNDHLGHSAGDELLAGAADCMRRTWGTVGHVFRVGGDEFIAIVPEDTCERLAELFDDLVGEWRGKYSEKLSVACGIAKASETGNGSIDDLLALADQRMYAEKSKMKEQ